MEGAIAPVQTQSECHHTSMFCPLNPNHSWPLGRRILPFLELLQLHHLRLVDPSRGHPSVTCLAIDELWTLSDEVTHLTTAVALCRAVLGLVPQLVASPAVVLGDVPRLVAFVALLLRRLHSRRLARSRRCTGAPPWHLCLDDWHELCCTGVQLLIVGCHESKGCSIRVILTEYDGHITCGTQR